MTQTHQTPLMQDLSRGFACKCPKCGEGKLFKKWLKVTDHCPVCNEEFHHHRADDFPAYVVIFIMGHAAVAFALELEGHFAPPFWWHMVLTLPFATILSLAMLQPVKGAIVALQWRIGMHGFKAARQKRDEQANTSADKTA